MKPSAVKHPFLQMKDGMILGASFPAARSHLDLIIIYLYLYIYIYMYIYICYIYVTFILLADEKCLTQQEKRNTLKMPTQG